MWASVILAVVKALPAVRDIYLQSVELYYGEMDRQMEQDAQRKQEEREEIVGLLKQDGLTSLNRAVLRRRLYDLQK